jgi:hypothetical protein
MEAQNGSCGGAPVVLNVYDLTPMNNYLYWFGLGIFHSGIEGTYVSTTFCPVEVVHILVLVQYLFGGDKVSAVTSSYPKP